MELDDVFRYLGNYGRHQMVILIFLNIFCTVIPGWLTMSVIFFTAEPDGYHCTPPEGLLPNETIPGMVDGDGVDGADQCRMYVVDDNGFITENKTKCLYGWDYTTTVPGETNIVTDFNLVCGKSLLAEIATSVYMAGVLAGAIPIGQVPDIIGRKPVFVVSLIVEAAVGVGLFFAWNYYVILILWVLAGLFREGLFVTGFVIMMEMFVPEQRAFVGSLMNVMWGVSMASLAGVAYIFPNWRHMQLFMSLMLLSALPFYRVLQESVRWLISQGRIKEAEDVLHYIAKFNKISPSPEQFLNNVDDTKQLVDICADGGLNNYTSSKNENRLNFQHNDDDKGTKVVYGQLYDDTEGENVEQQSSEKNEHKYNKLTDDDADVQGYSQPNQKRSTFLDLFKTWTMLKISLILFINCFANSIVYYGITLDSSNLAGNKYLNFFFLGLVEIPAYIMAYFSMEKYGRRISMVVTLVIAGVACVLTASLPKKTASGSSLQPLILACATIGKFMNSYSFSVMLVYSPELMPTVVRNAGIGFVSFAICVGGVLAPYVIYLDRVSSYLPLNILGFISIFAGLISLLLPETRNRPLPETIEDGENIYKAKPISKERSLSILLPDTEGKANHTSLT